MLSADITLPLDIDGEVVPVELAVEYEYTPGKPGRHYPPPEWSDPPEPAEVDVRKVRLDGCSVPCLYSEITAAVNRRVAAGWPELERRLIEAAQETFEE